MALQRRANHSAQKLSHIGGILGSAEGHHGLRSGAVPARRQIFFEQHHPDTPVIGNVRWVDVVNRQTVDGERTHGAKGMYNLMLPEGRAQPLLDFGDDIIQISIGDTLAAACQHLDHEHRIHLCIVLLIGILVPMVALFLPFIRCSV